MGGGLMRLLLMVLKISTLLVTHKLPFLKLSTADTLTSLWSVSNKLLMEPKLSVAM